MSPEQKDKQKKYVMESNKKQAKLLLTMQPDEMKQITDYCKSQNIPRNTFIKKAIDLYFESTTGEKVFNKE